MKPREPLSISKLAEQTGVTPRTIRYYITEGLLPPPQGAGQQRTYGQEHAVRLQLIKRLQQEHLPLQEIKARLERLSVADMERLLEKAPPVRNRVDPRRLLAAVLAPGAEAAAPPARAMLMREMVPAPAPASPPPMTESPLWKRTALAEGVELHYQAEGTPERDQALEAIITDARRRLAEAARQDGEGEGAQEGSCNEA